MSEIAIIGAGAWGTGIAIVLGRKGTHRVKLWAHEADVCESIMQKRLNEKFLPGRPIPQSVSASNDLGDTLRGAQIVVSVMPSQHCRALVRTHAPARATASTDRERDQRAGRRLVAADDRGDYRGDEARG